MKKFILAFVVLLVFISSNTKELIRIRVLANSNSEYDQKIKTEVVEIVKGEFKKILNNTEDVNVAREKISNNLDLVSNKVDKFLLEKKVPYSSTINFGINYFPPKEYNGEKYSEGYYESVLITLGSGEGDNWWCILFPSVCLTDSDVKYESFLKHILSKILK